MDQREDRKELERKIAQASRIVSSVSDHTTLGRLLAWIDELKQKLQRHREERLTREKIRRRAKELWEMDGRPAGRDLEFWLKAESEIADES